MRETPPVICPGGKHGYPRHVAEKLLEQFVVAETFRRRRPCRIYLCPKCDRWHLTAVVLVDETRAPSDPSFDPLRPRLAPPARRV